MSYRIQLGLAFGLSLIVASCDDSPPAFIEHVSPYQDADQDGGGVDLPAGGKPVTKLSAEWNFDASVVENAYLEYHLDEQVIHEYFTMTDITQDARIEHQQRERPMRTELFYQGSEHQKASETFRQAENNSGLLDLVVVIDNSASMIEEQENLSSKIVPLLSYIQDADWRIGVVTTDPDDGCLRSLISRGDHDYVQKFKQAIQAGTSGSGNERGILQARNALEMPCRGASTWLRPNSAVAVLIVSDEDNCSNGFMCFGAPWESPSYLLDYLGRIRRLGSNARIYGLIWHPSQEHSQCPTALNQAFVYADLIERSQGQWGSICDDDYSETLTSISEDISTILKSQFALRYHPFASTVTVTVNGRRQTSGFSVIDNVVEFDEPPPANAAITIDYQFTTDPPKDRFRLFGSPVPGTIEILLDGKPSSDYVFDGETIRFNKAPMVREIKVSYRQTGELERNFMLEPGLDPGAIQINIAGQRLAPENFLYETQTGLIRFHEAPSDGSRIVIDYQQILGPRLVYPAFMSASSLADLEVFDAATMSVMSFRLRDHQLIFDREDYLRGRRVLLRYPNPTQDSKLLELSWPYLLAGSFEVSGESSGVCERFLLASTRLDLSPCPFIGDELVQVRFSYLSEHRQEFLLPEAELSANALYEVRVNSKLVQDYDISDGVLSFHKPLPWQAKVNVKRMIIRDQ